MINTDRALLVGERGDVRTQALRDFLSRNQVPHSWISPDAPDLEQHWEFGPLKPEDLPALACDDGSCLKAISTCDAADALGLPTKPMKQAYDVVIIGAGPAGLAAAVFAASEGLSTLVIEREAPGGQAETSSCIENYLGFPDGVSGDDLAKRGHTQACRLGAEIIVTRTATSINPETLAVSCEGIAPVMAGAIVLATGVSWRRLDVPGLNQLLGRGVCYGASRQEAEHVRGKDIHLVGAGNSAGQAALFFAQHARTVTLVVRGKTLADSMSHYLILQISKLRNIIVVYDSEIVRVHGERQVERVEIANRNRSTVSYVLSGGVFIFIGADAATEWLPDAILKDEKGYVLTGDAALAESRELSNAVVWPLVRSPYLMETSVPGIFAAGDVRSGQAKRVAVAVGEGSMAINFVHQHLASVAADRLAREAQLSRSQEKT